jgi:transcriptional regulator with XRE-family HTH domain
MRKRQVQNEVGQRMEAAAQEQGLTAAEIAGQVKRAVATVHRWWSGDRRPSESDMEAYAQAVRRSAQYLWTGLELASLPEDTLDFINSDADLTAISNEELAREVWKRLVGPAAP